MSNTNEARKDNIIYTRLNPLSDELKSKLNLAFKDVVDRFKERHLS